MSTKISKNNPTDIVLQQWLQKKSKQFSRWRRRWVVLTTPSLYTFKNQEIDKNATEVINLSHIVSVKINKDQNTFMLIDRNNATWQFQCENHLQTKQWMNTIIAYVNCINIPITIDCKNKADYCCNFKLPIPYKIEYKHTLYNTITAIIKHLQKKYTPIQFEPIKIISDSFICKQIEYKSYDWDKSDINITDFEKEYIIQKGIHLLVDVAIYQHNISSMNITCPNINSNNICPIFYKITHNSICNENYMKHITEYNHYRNEYVDRQACMFDPCNSYKKLLKGGYDLKDRMHIKLYKHSARKTQYEFNMNYLSLNDEWAENVALYSPTVDDMIECVYTEQNGYLNTLIKEVIKNGYKKDLYIDGIIIESKDDNDNNEYNIMNIVDNLLLCKRHKQMGSPLNRAEMLSLVLYTHICDCHSNLCSTQSNNNYILWKWFDYCLYSAINKLSQKERGNYKTYVSLNSNIKLLFEFIECGFFKTYLSTTWIKDIAMKHLKNGIIFEIDEEFRKNSISCDVSWISKYGNNECEILIARSIDTKANCFECKIVNTNTNIQRVILSCFGAAERRKQNSFEQFGESKKYPLMKSDKFNNKQIMENNVMLFKDILNIIDGISEDIIAGYLRNLELLLIKFNNYDNYYINIYAGLIRTIVTLYFFNVYERSLYLYPEYVSHKNLNNILLHESYRIIKYPNIAFNENTQQLAIGIALRGKHCLFLYDLNITTTKEIKLKSSRVHLSCITACEFCTNGAFLITYSCDIHENQLKIWDIRNSQQQIIKTVTIEILNKKYSLTSQILHTRLVWTSNGVILQRANKSIIKLPEIKANKTHKTFIFIIEANSNKKKHSKKNKEDLPLSSIGIDEAYNLSKYIAKHSPIMKKTKTVKNEKETIEKPIQDALYMLELNILSENNIKKNKIPSNLLLQCKELRNILQDANGRIQRYKHEIESKKCNTLLAKHIEVNPNSIVSDYYDAFDEEEKNKIGGNNTYEIQLKTGWVLDELINNKNQNSIISCSNQRRTISTVMISLWDRFNNNNNNNQNEKIYLIPYLQELGYPLNEKINIPQINEYQLKCKKFNIEKLKTFYKKNIIIEKNKIDLNNVVFGKKSFDQQLRLELFCFWAFFKLKPNINTVIVSAHSNWFHSFLNTFLPKNATFSKAKRVPNCSLIAFKMVCDEIPDVTTYQIVEKSITNIYRGFK